MRTHVTTTAMLAGLLALPVSAACGTAAAPSGHPTTPTAGGSAPSPGPQTPPGPVSAHAALAGKCMTGIYDATAGLFYPLSAILNGTTIKTGDVIAEGYQLTLTDTSSTATAQVTSFAVVLYSGGQELTSDSQTLTAPSFITPGKSLTWTEYPWGTSTSGQGAAVGPYAAGQVGAVDPTATCQLVKTDS